MCGSDGETYENICELEGAEGERFDYEGEACMQESCAVLHSSIHSQSSSTSNSDDDDDEVSIKLSFVVVFVMF